MMSNAMNRRDFLRSSCASMAAGSLFCQGRVSAEGPRPNVLFIGVDDLRPQLGCYGQSQILSPNIDRLAREGLLFERTYCQQAICMASRASLLSGYRPNKGDIFRDGPLFECVPDALPLNMHFLNNGYETITIGKIYHHHSDEKKGWSREAFHAEGDWEGRGYLSPEAIAAVEEYDAKNAKARRHGLGPAFEGPDVPDDAYADGLESRHAVEELNRLQDRPFFLAMGFHKPHLPFNAPKKYWDLYDPDAIDLAENPFAPKGMPDAAGTTWGELRGYHGMPEKGPMPDSLARQLIHGYYACISYTDAMIGRLLDELDRLDLRKNTIVVLWGDHGWKLGEHGMWCKHTNFELDTHVPLIISAPGMETQGQRTRALTEFVDLYPTLCELTGLPLPAHLEGKSMAPLLADPNQPWKEAAYSQYPRSSTMGYSMRTDRYRYTEWRSMATKSIKARELYDHETDPAENTNIALDPANQALMETLSPKLQAVFGIAKD
ncbi:sulfatase [Roseovarius pacificus]|uniref:sulfatase n=1 Tax=Roseovarius pacificus TaxID=337701 RepID=UPI002A18CCF4|nr:sulfatase [Roseovarius pacificus]